MKTTKKDFKNNYCKNRLYFDGFEFWHYEPYYDNITVVAIYSKQSNLIFFTHGYYPKNKIGLKVLKAMPGINYR